MKRIYIVCAVRNATAEEIVRWREYSNQLKATGHTVHFPPDDAPQDDPTGRAICLAHRAAMLACDEVHVFWDKLSYGSHFDIGMAYALGKPILAIARKHPDDDGKSYWKAIFCE